jgi:hypothetical protein
MLAFLNREFILTIGIEIVQRICSVLVPSTMTCTVMGCGIIFDFWLQLRFRFILGIFLY